jgi:hypothetical protein
MSFNILSTHIIKYCCSPSEVIKSALSNVESVDIKDESTENGCAYELYKFAFKV